MPRRPATVGPSSVRLLWPYGAAVFTSAFLLFQVQLILGKYLLPWFGGTPGVWTACVLVFQVLLLAGYAYSHLLDTRVRPVVQGRMQRLLLGASILVMAAATFSWPSPILPGASWKPAPDDTPEWLIVRLLLASVGLPFVLLSTTAPLVQRWFSLRFPGRSPWGLYALSNLGSLLGLLAYPFLVERGLRLPAQGWAWFAGYCAFGLLIAACAPPSSDDTAADAPPARRERRADEPPPSAPRALAWLVLSATGSAMLLAVTNHLCQEVAVIPLLWVAPMALYLISFIVCFHGERGYPRGFCHGLYAVAALLMVGFNFTDFGLATRGQIAAFSFVLFACCMVCHGELYRLRPSSRDLTLFYLLIAAGGVLGGLFVSVWAPRAFLGYWELPVGFAATGALLLARLFTDEGSWLRRASWRRAAAVVSAVFGAVAYLASRHDPTWPEWLPWTLGGLAVMLFGIEWVARPRPPAARASATLRLALSSLWLAAAATLAHETVVRDLRALWRGRNFYGVLSIRRFLSPDPNEDAYLLHHGRTLHGLQFAAPSRRLTPTGYYRAESGIGRAVRSHPRLGAGLRLGVVGLGIGTLAGYAGHGDSVRFYEINPAVVDVARGRQGAFSVLAQSRGEVTVVPGDARLVLEREAPQGFDILAVDAFNSDAIPVHLITQEAVQVYLRHLRELDSVLAFHVTNRSVDLGPVLARLAAAETLHAVRVHSADVGRLEPGSAWVLMSRSETPLRRPEVAEAAWPLPGEPATPLWTDDYSNLARLLLREGG